MRTLKLNGYRVNHVMNITDVGHLVSDGDEGEDKMEAGSRRTGQTAWTIAALYTDAFRADLKALNINEPDVWCKATDHIAEQMGFIEEIEKKGYTYRTSDGIYFDTAKQPSYGYPVALISRPAGRGPALIWARRRTPPTMRCGSSPSPAEKRQMEWDSPWGRGFPGWHIECSAMAHKYLGEYF